MRFREHVCLNFTESDGCKLACNSVEKNPSAHSVGFFREGKIEPGGKEDAVNWTDSKHGRRSSLPLSTGF